MRIVSTMKIMALLGLGAAVICLPVAFVGAALSTAGC
jgi:hypothetical protein